MNDELNKCTALTANKLCESCDTQGWCPNLTSQIITSGQVTRQLMKEARNTMFEISTEERVTCSRFPFWLMKMDWDYLGRYVHPFTREITEIDNQYLFYDRVYDGKGDGGEDDKDSQNSELKIQTVPNLHSWYRQYKKPCGGLPYIPHKYLRRHATAFSILRATYPERCSHWSVM